MSPGRAFVLPFLFTAGLLGLALYPPVRQNPRLLWSFLGTGAVLLAWNGLLLVSAVRTHRVFTLDIVLRKQHYVQAFAHASIFVYWGWYWRPVYESAYLIIAQLCFAYALDMLLAWSRRDACTLGFGPFPIVLSTNLFLWFKQDWFFLQFVMIALGFAAKEFIRWNKDGRQTHIFNPSSFTLTIFSLVLILTGTSDITWAKDIAITQFYPPHMYLFLFVVALPGQFLFGVTTMTMSAVLATYVFGLAYYAATGTYFFFDSYIPIAVFLGMHLLFTDPSTAPRTELGRMIFGALYGLSTVALYALLGRSTAGPGAQLVDPIDRPSGPIGTAATVRSGGDRAFPRCSGPHAGVHGCLGDRVRRHDRCARRGRWPSWPVDSVLAGGLPAGSRLRLSVSGAGALDLLHCGLGLVVQRAGHSAGRYGDGSACSVRVDAARLRARLSARMRQPHHAVQRWPEGHWIPAARGASNSPARKQRAHHRSECRLALRARLRPGLARQLWSGRQFGQPVVRPRVPYNRPSLLRLEALLRESSLAHMMPTDRALTCRSYRAGPALSARRPDITMEIVDRFLTRMYRTNADFVYTVTRDFVRSCQTPILVLPDDTPGHPYAVAMESAMLAPKSEVSIFPWKEPKERIPLAVRHIRSFLRAHRPTSV